jgi:Protein of unknown function (DUF742)
MSGVERPRPAADDDGAARVYAGTGDRTRSAGRVLPIESVVTRTARARRGHDLDIEYRTVIELASRPVSLAEISVALTVPVAVAQVLVSELVDGGYLVVHTPPPALAERRLSAELLTRLLGGLRDC